MEFGSFGMGDSDFSGDSRPHKTQIFSVTWALRRRLDAAGS
jgi:hypothetical protein